MSFVLLALGLVLILEGLALALAPLRMEDLMRIIAGLSREQRRMIGLAGLALGVALVWLSGAWAGAG
ncbi:DUF2065 family protein [Tabrizicola sp.]|uniref:DUF2065 family protein n=1 Tax=Tabrizicola sp. TaxID=2005166 RepID=UPI00286CC04F|nr:DUF2065 family protein [Tabrizicola sp.]